MAWLRSAATVALILFSTPDAIAQIAPRPFQEGGVAKDLVHAFAVKDESRYAALLADDVRVFEDGEIVAQNKAAWLKRFGPLFSSKNVSFKLSPSYASTGRLLFVEFNNFLGSWGETRPVDCCWEYHAVAYDVSHGNITTIRRLHGGTLRIDNAGKVSGEQYLWAGAAP
jgi:hypothetical protein